MKPLKGIRVIDLSTFIAAPTATLMLADWGADVIKVENLAGDPMRTVAPARRIPLCSDDENPYFDGVGANKRFVSLSTRTPEGLVFLKKLIKSADILITNYRTKALEGLGLTYEELSREQPGLVFGQVLGFGEKGPDKDKPGFDYTAYVARGGILNNMSPPGGDAPIYSYSGFGDNQVGISLACGVMAALVGKMASGKGDKVTVSLYGAAIYMSKWALCEAQFGVEFPMSVKNPSVPLVNAYKASDEKWMQVCISEYDRYYNDFVTMLGREDLVDHPVYSRINGMVAQDKTAEFTEIIAKEIGCIASDDVLARADTVGLTMEKGYSFPEILADEQAWANDYMRKITYPTGNTATVFPNLVHFKNAGPAPYERAKPLGSDNNALLAELGYSEAEIADMREKKAVK